MIQLLTVSDMRESDQQTIADSTPSKELMYRAGEAIFNIVKTYPSPIAIICGNGNNAGDGYVLATLLKKEGIDCSIFRITDRFSDDGLFFYNQCIDLGITDISLSTLISESANTLSDFSTIVDCIFGTGFHGDVKEPQRSIITAINSSQKNVLSVDINSGLNGDSGLCDICVHSDLTISIGNMKPGHLLNMAKDVCKQVINCDIGINPINDCIKIYQCEDKDFIEVFKDRPQFCNKGSFGYIGLIGASQLYGGAIRLANMAACAMRSGAGVVKLAAPSSLSNVIMPAILESTFYPLSDDNGNMIFVEDEYRKLLNLSTIAFGMGIGNTTETKKALEYLLKNYKGILIIDADGLNALSQMDNTLLNHCQCQVVITPHPKEFSRLCGLSVEEILCKPIEYATKYATEKHVIVLLKGTSTIITDGTSTLITNRGCAGMATAGSGDVLSGILAAVCGYSDDLLLAVAASAHINGIAGELAQEKYGDISMISSDTVSNLSEAILSIKRL